MPGKKNQRQNLTGNFSTVEMEGKQNAKATEDLKMTQESFETKRCF